MLTKGFVLLHDNAHQNTAARTNTLIHRINCKIFDHSSYSPDLAPNYYHHFSKMKDWLATQRFHCSEELMNGAKNRLYNLAAPLFEKRLQKTSVTKRQMLKCGWKLCG
jgi:hypothetical protein